jgi:hypothetical protein
MRLPLAFTLISLSLAACGGDDSATPDAPTTKDVGFNKPTKGLKANMEGDNGWMELGPADLSCLNTPSADQATTVEVSLRVNVADFQSGNPVTKATITAFKDVMTDQPFDTQMDDTDAHATITIPVGTKRFGYKMTTEDGSTVPAMPTFLLNQTVAPDEAMQPADSSCGTPPCYAKIQSVSVSTATTLPALIGETRNPSTGVIAGALRDCQQHEISNFVATVSTTQGTATPVEGAEAYYFSAGVELPVRHNSQEAASGDGLFMVIQLPATPTAYVQMWGYKTDDDAAAGGDMTLVAELQVPVLADTVITGSYEPLRQ